jgi:hypothetical protein
MAMMERTTTESPCLEVPILGDLRDFTSSDTIFHAPGRTSPEEWEPFVGPSELDELVNASGIPLNVILGGRRRNDASRETVASLMGEGWSLQLECIERYSKRMRQLCGSIASALDAKVRANAYITPASSDPAFRIHHDVTVSMVVQVVGEKRWRCWNPILKDPVWIMKDHTWSVDGISPHLDVTLRPGDVLWLPHGAPHEVHPIGDEPSIHLTFGIHRTSGVELLEWITSELVEIAGFRLPKPWGSESAADTDWVATHLNQLGAWISGVSPSDILSAFMIARAARSEREVLDLVGTLRRRAITPQDRVGIADPLLRPVIVEDNLYSLGLEADLPPTAVLAVEELVLSRKVEQVSELSARFGLDELEFSRVIDALVRVGVLKVIASGENELNSVGS